MPKLNKNLVRSIVKDLKNLEKSCNVLRKRVQNVDCISWRYPTERCHNICVSKILSKFKGSPYECYLLILELMYDRFQYFLNLMIKYLDMIPLISEEFSLPQNVVNPGLLSTGALLNILWTRIELLHNSFLQMVVKNRKYNMGNQDLSATFSLGALLSQSISAPKSHQLNSFSRSCQTEQCSLMKCENCSISEEILKFIVNEIEMKCTENNMQALLSNKSFTMNMKKEAMDVSQWGAIRKCSETIKADLKLMLQTVIKQTEANEAQKKLLLLEENRVNEKLKLKDQEIKDIEEIMQSLQLQLKEAKLQITSMDQEKEVQNLQISKLNESVEQVKSKLEISEAIQKGIADHNVRLKSHLQIINSDIGLNISNFNDYDKMNDEWKKFIALNNQEKTELKHQVKEALSSLQAKEQIFKAEIEKRDVIIKYEKEKHSEASYNIKSMRDCAHEVQNLKKENDQLQSKLNDAEQKISSLTLITEDLEKELQQKKQREKLLLEYPDTNTRIQVEVHGNPEQDMENQIKANKIRIKLLSEQITKLEGTLNKLRKLTKGQTQYSLE